VGRHHSARIEFAQEAARGPREFEEKGEGPGARWFFDPFVPRPRVSIPDVASEGGAHTVPWESVSTDQLAARPALLGARAGRSLARLRRPRSRLRHHRSGQAHLAHARFDRKTGAYEAHGIPAPVVAQYLRENRVVPEKNDLNSLLFLLTPGVESSKAGTLVSSLVAFKRLHDDNVPLEDAMPEFVARRRRAIAASACATSGRHARLFREAGVSACRRRSFEGRAPAGAWSMTPARPARLISCATNVDYRAARNALEGRVATRCSVRSNPPGIATIVPGAALRARRPMIGLSQDVRAQRQHLPRFESEIKGLIASRSFRA